MSDLKPLRLLILGGGAVTSNFYVPAIKELNWIEGSLVVDTSESSIAMIRKADCSIAVHQASFRDYLKSASNSLCKRFDASIIALPNCFHEEAVDLCLRHGLHVLCEKPLAMGESTCLRLAEFADRANLSSSVMVLTHPSTRSRRAPAHAGEAGVLAHAATAPAKRVMGV